MMRARTVAAVMSLTLWACSAPSLHPLYAPDALMQDPGLVGEWASDDGQTVTRVVVSEGSDGKYLGVLTIHRDAELKTGLSLEVSLTQIGEDHSWTSTWPGKSVRRWRGGMASWRFRFTSS